MKNYPAIRSLCEKNSNMFATVNCEFQFYYAAGDNNLEHKMELELL